MPIFPHSHFYLKILLNEYHIEKSIYLKSRNSLSIASISFFLLNFSKIKCSTLIIFQMHTYVGLRASFVLSKAWRYQLRPVPLEKLKWDPTISMKILEIFLGRTMLWVPLSGPPLASVIWTCEEANASTVSKDSTPSVCLVPTQCAGFHCSVGAAGN